MRGQDGGPEGERENCRASWSGEWHVGALRTDTVCLFLCSIGRLAGCDSDKETPSPNDSAKGTCVGVLRPIASPLKLTVVGVVPGLYTQMTYTEPNVSMAA